MRRLSIKGVNHVQPLIVVRQFHSARKRLFLVYYKDKPSRRLMDILHILVTLSLLRPSIVFGCSERICSSCKSLNALKLIFREVTPNHT